jgi:hypothetical protein
MPRAAASVRDAAAWSCCGKATAGELTQPLVTSTAPAKADTDGFMISSQNGYGSARG